MADNILVTVGSGDTVPVATDEVATIHYQRIKLDIGGDGASSPVVTGNPLPVTVLSALPAGTNGIGKLTANSGVDIGDVDVISSALPTGAATSAKQDTLLTELQAKAGIVDDAAFTVGTTKVAPAAGVYKSTVDAVDDGDAGAFHMTARRALHSTIRKESDGSEMGVVATAPLYMRLTDGTTAIDPGTEYAEGATDATITGTAILWEDTSDTLRPVSAAKPLPVGDAGGSLTVDNTGTFSVQVSSALPAGTNGIGKLTANSGIDIGDVDVTSITGVTMSNAAIQSTGDEAHDAVDAGNPVKVGYKAIAHGANPTAVAANDRTDAYANRHGVPWMIGGHPNVITLEAAYTAAQTDTAVVASISAGMKVVVTQLAALCDNANTVDVGIRIGFGATTTPTTTGVILTHPGLAPGSGFSRGSGSGILGVGADGDEVRVTCEVPTTGSVRVLISYYTIES